MEEEAWHGTFSQSLGYAVATTHTQAIVWSYAPKKNTIDSSKSYTINLPFGSSARHSGDPLPLATLVHDAGAGELALLVALPNGKLVYWESVPSAATGDIARQKQQGLQSSVGGMFSSEHITDLTDAEPDGFILTSSVGRIIHLSVRDSQGRPAISLHYLRSNSTSTSLLGSFRNVFSSSAWKREIAAVRPGLLRGKNSRRCIAANVQGHFQIWDLARHGSQNLEFEIDAKAQILSAIQAVKPAMNDNYLDFQLLDFSFEPTAPEKQHDSDKLFVLVALADGTSNYYFLVVVKMQKESLEVDVVYPISCWSTAPSVDSDWPTFKPRLLLPHPAHTAFLVFDTYLIMVSLGKVGNTSDTQIQQESHALSESYQDVLFINRDNFDHIVGCAVEPSEQDTNRATCLILAQTFGLARASAKRTGENVLKDERRASKCRSCIEQAVFFKHSQGNLFDFRFALSAVDWEQSEVERATLDINDSIIDNDSQYIPAMMPSMDHQLTLRATALIDLIKCVGKYAISQPLRWHLLQSAEKIAGSKAIWRTYNDTLSTKGPNDKVLLPELLDMIHEKYKHENEPERGETDIVRHYFTLDVKQLGLLIPWAQKSVEELWIEGVTSPKHQAYLTSQANDIVNHCLEAAFDFRQQNAEVFGVRSDIIEDGIFQGDHAFLKDNWWTSMEESLKYVKKLVDLDREIAVNNAESPQDEDGGISEDLAIKLSLDNPKLVHHCCQIFEERIRFLNSRPDDKAQESGKQTKATYLRVRHDMIFGLTDIGLYTDAFKLAEQYQDMKSLVEVFDRFQMECAVEINRPGISEDDRIAVEQKWEETEARKQRYFRNYGARWASAVYDRKLMNGELRGLLTEDAIHHNFLTQYLRNRSDLSGLTWMHEVAQGNFKLASEDLTKAQRNETHVWSKKIELSMAKLTMLAAAEKGQVDKENLAKVSRKADRRLEILEVQEQLYAYIKPLLSQAIDRTAAVDLAMESFGDFVADKPVLHEILKKHLCALMEKRALDAEELIDTLTLLSGSSQPTEDSFTHLRFYFALKLLKLTGFDGDRKHLHQQLIWRRCLLQDDWAALNRTEKKDDYAVAAESEGTIFFQTLKQGFREGRLQILY